MDCTNKNRSYNFAGGAGFLQQCLELFGFIHSKISLNFNWRCLNKLLCLDKIESLDSSANLFDQSNLFGLIEFGQLN